MDDLQKHIVHGWHQYEKQQYNINIKTFCTYMDDISKKNPKIIFKQYMDDISIKKAKNISEHCKLA